VKTLELRAERDAFLTAAVAFVTTHNREEMHRFWDATALQLWRACRAASSSAEAKIARVIGEASVQLCEQSNVFSENARQ
jgi:hypothetical protein